MELKRISNEEIWAKLRHLTISKGEFSAFIDGTKAQLEADQEKVKAIVQERFKAIEEYVGQYGRQAVAPEDWETQYVPLWQALKEGT